MAVLTIECRCWTKYTQPWDNTAFRFNKPDWCTSCDWQIWSFFSTWSAVIDCLKQIYIGITTLSCWLSKRNFRSVKIRRPFGQLGPRSCGKVDRWNKTQSCSSTLGDNSSCSNHEHSSSCSISSVVVIALGCFDILCLHMIVSRDRVVLVAAVVVVFTWGWQWCYQVREGQKVKSEVQLATEDFVLVLLKGHAAGQFAYLPAKRVCLRLSFLM